MRDATRAGKRSSSSIVPIPLAGRRCRATCVRARAIPIPPSRDFMPVAMRYGMTLGELARLANDALALGTDLSIVPAVGGSVRCSTTRPASRG